MSTLIECVESKNHVLLNEKLKERDMVLQEKGWNGFDPELSAAIKFVLDQYDNWAALLKVFVNWLNIDGYCDEDTDPMDVNTLRYMLRTECPAASFVIDGDVESLRKYFDNNPDLISTCGFGRFFHYGISYMGLLDCAIDLCVDDQVIKYLLSDTFLPKCFESDSGEHGIAFCCTLRSALKTLNHYAVERLMPYVTADMNPNCFHELIDYAVKYDKTEIVRQCIVELPVSINYVDDKGDTLLHFAVRSGYIDIVKLLHDKITYTSNKRGETPLYYAVAAAYFDIVEFLLSNGVTAYQEDIEWRAEITNWSLTHVACMYGRKDIYDLLVKYGFAPDQPDRWGMFPLDYLKSNTAK